MNSTQLQASGVSTFLTTCIAYTAAGHICGRPATVMDNQRGGMVCGIHSPGINRPYEVTRSYLAKAEDLLMAAAEHARKEAPAGPPAGPPQINVVKIVSLAVAARRIRFELEGGE